MLLRWLLWYCCGSCTGSVIVDVSRPTCRYTNAWLWGSQNNAGIMHFSRFVSNAMRQFRYRAVKNTGQSLLEICKTSLAIINGMLRACGAAVQQGGDLPWGAPAYVGQRTVLMSLAARIIDANVACCALGTCRDHESSVSKGRQTRVARKPLCAERRAATKELALHTAITFCPSVIQNADRSLRRCLQGCRVPQDLRGRARRQV